MRCQPLLQLSCPKGPKNPGCPERSKTLEGTGCPGGGDGHPKPVSPFLLPQPSRTPVRSPRPNSHSILPEVVLGASLRPGTSGDPRCDTPPRPPLERRWPSIPRQTPHIPTGKPTNGSPEHPDLPKMRPPGRVRAHPEPPRPLTDPSSSAPAARASWCWRLGMRAGTGDLRALRPGPGPGAPRAAARGSSNYRTAWSGVRGPGRARGQRSRCGAEKLSGAGSESGGGGVGRREKGRDEGQGRRDLEREGGAEDSAGAARGGGKGGGDPRRGAGHWCTSREATWPAPPSLRARPLLLSPPCSPSGPGILALCGAPMVLGEASEGGEDCCLAKTPSSFPGPGLSADSGPLSPPPPGPARDLRREPDRESCPRPASPGSRS